MDFPIVSECIFEIVTVIEKFVLFGILKQYKKD